MKKFLSILLILFLLLVPCLNQDASLAQDNTASIFFLMDGDIWSYNTATDVLAQRTDWGYTGSPILSPDGTQFAYLSVARVAVETYQDNPDLRRLDPEPTNVYVWELATDQASRLVDQPDSAAVSAEGETENTSARRELTWSPDGSQLAWIDNSSELVIYDFASQSQRVLPVAISSNSFRMRWGTGGLAIERAVEFVQIIDVYDPNSGEFLWQTTIDGEADPILDFFWMESGQLGGFFESGVAAFLDDGQVRPMHGMPTLYSLQSPQNTTQQLSLNAHDGFSHYIEWMNLSIALYNVERTATVSGTLTISPDGSQAAYLSFGHGLVIYQDGDTRIIANTSGSSNGGDMGVVWGASGWRESADVVCPNAIPPRLKLGLEGRVIDGLGANIIRDRPGLDEAGSSVIGTIPESGVFETVASFGYACMNGIRWWYVDYENISGYTGEGEGTTYWVEPL